MFPLSNYALIEQNRGPLPPEEEMGLYPSRSTCFMKIFHNDVQGSNIYEKVDIIPFTVHTVYSEPRLQEALTFSKK